MYNKIIAIALSSILAQATFAFTIENGQITNQKQWQTGSKKLVVKPVSELTAAKINKSIPQNISKKHIESEKDFTYGRTKLYALPDEEDETKQHIYEVDSVAIINTTDHEKNYVVTTASCAFDLDSDQENCAFNTISFTLNPQGAFKVSNQQEISFTDDENPVSSFVAVSDLVIDEESSDTTFETSDFKLVLE